MSKISIHLVTWNGQKYIADCLESIFKQSFEDFFLLIIDNGSIDDTVSLIEQTYIPLFGDKIRLIKNKENMGFAKAHNQALLWTDSPYALLLNQDVILDPDFLNNAVSFMESHRKVGSITGKIFRWEGKIDELTEGKKSDTVDTLGISIFKSQRVAELGCGEQGSDKYSEPQEVFGVSGNAPVYNRKALEDIRYKDEFFDNDFVSYKEDVDVAYRLRWRGWRSFMVPSVVAYHDRTAQGHGKVFSYTDHKLRRKKSSFVNYFSHRNQLFLLYKNLSARLFLLHSIFIIPYELSKVFFMLIFETKNLKSLSQAWKKRNLMKEKRSVIQKQRIISDAEMRKWFN